MNLIKYCLVIMITCLSASLAAAPSDYAWKTELESKQGALNKLVFGANIIKGLGRDDFGDLVVLDADGVAAPSWVRPLQQVTEVLEVPVDFHTFSEYSGAHSKTVTATNESKSQDSRSSVQTTETLRVAKASNAFVVEFSEYQMALGITALRLDWEAKDKSQLLELRVEASNSLNNWKTVHNRVALAHTKEDGDSSRNWQLVNDIPAAKRYIRLSSANPELPITLSSVRGLYEESTLKTIDWLTIGSLASEATDQNAYRFVLPKGMPPTRMRLSPAQQNQIIKGTIYAGDKYRSKHTLFSSIQQHSLAPAANIIASPTYAVPNRHYENWWFVSEAVLQEAPALEVGYERQELAFLANGKPPYFLYWGNYEASPPSQLLRDVLNNKEDLETAFDAKLLQIEVSSGVQRQFAAPTVPWLRWGLWLLLAIAALFTARMAIGLFREMK
ncbi:MAG: DUF3999 family protein [Pseudomonadales bacterium]